MIHPLIPCLFTRRKVLVCTEMTVAELLRLFKVASTRNDDLGNNRYKRKSDRPHLTSIYSFNAGRRVCFLDKLLLLAVPDLSSEFLDRLV